MEFSLFDLLMAATVVGYGAFVIGVVAGVHYVRTSASDAVSSKSVEATPAAGT